MLPLLGVVGFGWFNEQNPSRASTRYERLRDQKRLWTELEKEEVPHPAHRPLEHRVESQRSPRGLHREGGGYKAIFPAVGRWLNLRQLSLVSTEKEREPPPAATLVWTPADLTGVGKSCSGNTGHGYSIQPGWNLPIGFVELEFLWNLY